jgi:hypothetical protein
MIAKDQTASEERLRQALEAFQKLQALGLEVHRRLNGQGRRIDAALRQQCASVGPSSQDVL